MASLITVPEYAHSLREELHLAEDDVVGDIVEIIKGQGYDYVEERNSDGYAGFSEHIGNLRFRIGFNNFHDYGIQFKRFTLAHELGHVSMLPHQEILLKRPLHRSYQKDKYDKDIELEADNFAAHFLAPSRPCEKLIAHSELSPSSIKKVSEHFIISTYAAALRFIELTDLVCTIIVCNDKFKTEHERRSPKMKEMLKHRHIAKTDVHPHTLTYEYIKGKRDKTACESSMNLWHNCLPKDVPVTESVLDLGYGGKFMTLLTPTIPYLDEYLAEEEKSPTIY